MDKKSLFKSTSRSATSGSANAVAVASAANIATADTQFTGLPAHQALQPPLVPPAHYHHHSSSKVHRSSTTSHHHHNHHSQQRHSPISTPIHLGTSGKSNNNSITTLAKTPAGAANSTVFPLDHVAGHHVSLKLSARNKNDEAIADLRHRIPEIENIFDVHSRIGNGTFSTVLLGTLKKERDLSEHMRRKFAIKHHIPTSHPDRIMKELKCMAKIGGVDNVVGINCCIRYNESVAFIMPYMQHDRFNEFFSKMELSELQYYMKNLLIALRHVHKFNVIHRDVKPSNFLYNRRKREYLLVDFGLAQQVPNAQTGSNINQSLPTTTPVLGIDGKRAREADLDIDASPSKSTAISGAIDLAAPNADIAGIAKRLCCSGPHGDQHQLTSVVATGAPNPRIANSCSIMSGPTQHFKMPLKQLNEITTGGKTLSGVIGSGGSNSVYDLPIGRQVKSAIVTSTSASRSQNRFRLQGGQAGRASMTNNSVGVVPIAGGPDCGTIKYNTNRNLSSSNNGSKCFCYGNPQVCNMCLVKKEIHAARAGTPGYRPPEVLLKYPDQTTSVDIWAAGVIFLSILSSVYPFFKAPTDFVALAEMVSIFGDKNIRKTAFVLDRLVTLSQRTRPLDLRKLCVRFRNRAKFSSPELLKKYQRSDGTCEVCRNCDQFYFNCLCEESIYDTEPLDKDDPFPASAYDLLYKLLEVNPHKRISAEEALQHPFFRELPKTHKTPGSTPSTANVAAAAAAAAAPAVTIAAANTEVPHKKGRD